MKNVLLLLFLATTNVLIYGQARLGSSVTSIKSEFWESEYNLQSGYDNDGDYFITIETERASVIYYFNADKICTTTIIAPDNQGALNFYVELYNKQYVIISSTEWKMYSKEGIANIELVFADEGYFFVWK